MSSSFACAPQCCIRAPARPSDRRPGTRPRASPTQQPCRCPRTEPPPCAYAPPSEAESRTDPFLEPCRTTYQYTRVYTLVKSDTKKAPTSAVAPAGASLIPHSSATGLPEGQGGSCTRSSRSRSDTNPCAQAQAHAAAQPPRAREPRCPRRSLKSCPRRAGKSPRSRVPLLALCSLRHPLMEIVPVTLSRPASRGANQEALCVQ